MAEDWRDRALCRETDPEAFFPEKGAPPRDAKRICMGCDVRAECLEFALATGQPYGVWGGKSQRERRKLRKDRARTADREGPAAGVGVVDQAVARQREESCGMNATELTDRAGITYRQFDYWCRAGWLRPLNPTPGIGGRREFTSGEAAVAICMAGLVEAGLTIESASAIARGDRAALGVLLRTLGHVLDERGGQPSVSKEGS